MVLLTLTLVLLAPATAFAGEEITEEITKEELEESLQGEIEADLAAIMTKMLESELNEEEISALSTLTLSYLAYNELEKDSSTIARAIAFGLDTIDLERVWTWPTTSEDISFGFGQRWHPVWGGGDFHNGVDILGSFEDEIVAARDGTVTYAGWFSGYGNTVILKHEDEFGTLYGHGNQVLVNVGQEVKKGEAILLMGSTGISSATHLHLGLLHFGEWIDPLSYIKPKQY